MPSGTTVLEAAHQNQVPTLLTMLVALFPAGFVIAMLPVARSTWRVLAKHLWHARRAMWFWLRTTKCHGVGDHRNTPNLWNENLKSTANRRENVCLAGPRECRTTTTSTASQLRKKRILIAVAEVSACWILFKKFGKTWGFPVNRNVKRRKKKSLKVWHSLGSQSEEFSVISSPWRCRTCWT